MTIFLNFLNFQMSMNAKRGQPANVQNANARIHGAVMSAAAVVVYYTCENMTHA